MGENIDTHLEMAKKSGLTYDRLFELAYKMHLELFHLAGDEKEIYNKIGLTNEENELFGYVYVKSYISDPEIAKKLKDLIDNRNR